MTMKKIDLSDEDFEYLRLIVRYKTNAAASELVRVQEFSDEAHETFELGAKVLVGDAMVLSGLSLGHEIMVRIDEALSVAEDVDTAE